MKTNKKTHLLRWMLAIGVTAALAGGAAYAMTGECWNCIPCGCASDGGYLMCCDAYGC
jgi:hypothetical protein